MKFRMLNDKTRFIIVFIAFALVQVIVNIYRIYCNVIYTPMARSGGTKVFIPPPSKVFIPPSKDFIPPPLKFSSHPLKS